MEQLQWKTLLNSIEWRQGEHVSIFGRTGSGKTTLALELIKKARSVVLLLNKIRDPVLEHYIKRYDYDETGSWQTADPISSKIALWPRFYGVESFDDQYDVFSEAINGNRKRKIKGIFREGAWTVVIDEVLYFVKQLGLNKELDMLWTQGRSNDISVVASSQRPFFVPQNMLDQATHFFIFGYKDKRDIDRLRDALGDYSPELREYIPKLGKHEFIYVDVDNDRVIRSIVHRS